MGYHTYICLRDWGRPRISSGGCIAFHGVGQSGKRVPVRSLLWFQKFGFNPHYVRRLTELLLTVCAAVCIFRPCILNNVICTASSILPNETEFSIIRGANFDVLQVSTGIRAAAMCNSASYHHRNSTKVMDVHGGNIPKYLHVQICDILEIVT